jgi:hypothetical protein
MTPETGGLVRLVSVMALDTGNLHGFCEMIFVRIFIIILGSLRNRYERLVTGHAFSRGGRFWWILIPMAHRARDATIFVAIGQKFVLLLNHGYAGAQHNRYNR